jgi:hypothetical protein
MRLATNSLIFLYGCRLLVLQMELEVGHNGVILCVRSAAPDRSKDFGSDHIIVVRSTPFPREPFFASAAPVGDNVLGVR